MMIRKIISEYRWVAEIFVFFLASRLLVLLVGWLPSFVFKNREWYGNPVSLVDLFFRWDSRWYLSVAMNGYSYTPGQQSSIAFFPLYPVLVKLFSFAGMGILLSGILLSNVALFLAMLYLYKLVEMDYKGERIALNSVYFALMFPASIFFSLFYSESLFLLLSIACFYYARKGRWFASSLLGYFSALTRIVGVLLIIPLFIEYIGATSIRDIKIPKLRRDILFMLGPPAGLFTYMIYLFLTFNEPLAFYKSGVAWNRGFVSIITTLVNTYASPLLYKVIYYGFAFLAVLVLIYLILSRVRLSYIAYTGITLFVIFSSHSLGDAPRVISVIFPLYLGFALMARENFCWGASLKLFSIILLSMFVVLFTNGYSLY
jgi:hypothetical protein